MEKVRERRSTNRLKGKRFERQRGSDMFMDMVGGRSEGWAREKPEEVAWDISEQMKGCSNAYTVPQPIHT